ncbi:MAG TPA: hypothetical protein VGE45_08800 [Chloroflexia bacterium]|jgi:hypothetical protein
MDITLVASILAIIASIVTISKGVIEALKEGEANKGLLRKLARNPWARLATGLAVVGVGLLLWWGSKTPYVLNVVLWDVNLDERGSALASNQFRGRTDIGLSKEAYAEIGAWCENDIRNRLALTDEPVTAHIRIPADLAKEEIQVTMTPDGPYDVYVTQVTNAGKVRWLLETVDLAQVGGDFELEIRRPGYEVKSISVSRQQQQPREQILTLKPVPVGVGFEKFEGTDNSVHVGLINYFTTRSRFTVKDPTTLERLRAKIEQEKAEIAMNPFIQQGIRTTLGVDFLISGTFEQKKP